MSDNSALAVVLGSSSILGSALQSRFESLGLETVTESSPRSERSNAPKRAEMIVVLSPVLVVDDGTTRTFRAPVDCMKEQPSEQGCLVQAQASLGDEQTRQWLETLLASHTKISRVSFCLYLNPRPHGIWDSAFDDVDIPMVLYTENTVASQLPPELDLWSVGTLRSPNGPAGWAPFSLGSEEVFSCQPTHASVYAKEIADRMEKVRLSADERLAHADYDPPPF